MRVLFLDVDGVLNCRADFTVGKGTLVLCDRKLALIRDVMRETDCHFVLSSTWRLGEDHVSYLRERMGHWFYDAHAHPVAPTTSMHMKGHRGHEINEWFMRNDTPTHPITGFAIVDDDSDFMAYQIPHLVQTTFDEGLTPTHVKSLTRILLAPQERNAHNGHIQLVREHA